MENFSYDEDSGSFCVYATYFDDYMGHCWHKYYYYADENGLKEYGAIPITQEGRKCFTEPMVLSMSI